METRWIAVPEEFLQNLPPHAKRDLRAIFVHLNSFPNAVAVALRWSVEEVIAAREKLKRKLKGLIESSVLE